MKKYVVISANNNPDYYFYAPYQEKAWNKLGWDLCVMITEDVNVADLNLKNESTVIVKLPNLYGLRTETIAQAGRLYAANHLPLDSFIMTSDMDLIPLSNYWTPDRNDMTVYGYDLTDFTQYPIGYICMNGHKWKDVMRLFGDTKFDMTRDAKEFEHLAYAADWERWWGYDQELITNRLKPFDPVIIKRGRQSNGFAFGRVDRGNGMQLISGELIDAHCENNNVRHPDKLNKFLSLYEQIYGL